MAVQTNRLTARSVLSIKAAGRHADGGNLYLHVSSTGAKSWVFMFRKNGRQREMGLGPLRDVSLAEARELASRHRRSLRDGIDPLQARIRTVAKPMFGSFASEYIIKMQSQWRSPKHLQAWRRTLERHASSLSKIAIDEIGTDDVLAVLSPLWRAYPETASRLRGRIEAVLHAATARGLRTGSNPAAWSGHLKALLPQPRPKGSRGSFAAMPIDELPGFMIDLRQVKTVPARALEFLILSAARSGEVFGATWSEMDFEKRLWTIPASRMKASVIHRVPLCQRTMEILEEERRGSTSKIVFCGLRTGAQMANTSLNRTLRRLRPDLTVHGFRSTFRDWASERTGFANEVVEMALAHVISNQTEAAYRRGDLLEKRRRLMSAWASFASQATAHPTNIVALELRDHAR